MKKIIFTLLFLGVSVFASEGYFDCTTSKDECTFMKYDEKTDSFYVSTYKAKDVMVYTKADD